MPLSSVSWKLFFLVCLTVFYSTTATPMWAQQPSAMTSQALTIERIYSQPSLSGRLTRGLAWTPDGKLLSYFEDRANGKNVETELWILDTSSGERRMLISSDKLQTILPGDLPKATQVTGLRRPPPAAYQWAPSTTPGGGAILFEGPTALAWFDLKTQSARTLVSGKAPLGDPKISPDGRYVSFVRNHNLWFVKINEGEVRALTHGGSEDVRKGELDWIYPEELQNKTAYWWAPDSSSIAFFEMDERLVPQYPLVDFRSFDGDAQVERYPPAGAPNPIVRVFTASLNGGEARLMDTGVAKDMYLPRVTWLPDSKRLAVERLNRAQNEIELLIANVSSGKSRVVLSEKDQYWINVSDDLYFFKDGKRFLWSSERSGYRHLYLYDLDSKQIQQLTKGDWEVTAVSAVDEAKGLVFFTATEKSPLERHLFRVALDGSGFARVTGDAGTHTIDISPDAAVFIDTYSNTVTPPRQDLRRADGSFLTAINENKVTDLAGYHLSPIEFLSVRSHDHIELNAMMIKPPDFNPQQKYPVLVFTYGGPRVQIVLNAWGGSTLLWEQLMAQKGYIIFALDNRGSAGRGHLFEEPIHYRLGAQELSDQRDGVEYLKSIPFVDAKRLGIWGWRYGGHLTLHAMFEDPEDFKVGFAGSPVTNWHYYDSIYTERYLGLLPGNEESYQESSAIEKVKQLRGKLLIAHGTGDDNVHFANTLALIDDFIEQGKYIEVLLFPGRSHGVNDLPACRLLMQRVTDFFLDNL
jgi:dipeptidyl-peptidase-4